MLAAVRRLLDREGVRFALVGGVNTVFGYGAFVLLELFLGDVLPYLVVLLVSYVLGVSGAFVLQRWLVFRHEGAWFPAYLRFWSVYVVFLAVNLVLLPVLVEIVGLPVVPAQLAVLLLVACGSYAAHSRFSFAKATPTDPLERTDG